MDIRNAEKIAAILNELNETKDVLDKIVNNGEFSFVIRRLDGHYFLDKTVHWTGQDDWRTLVMIEAYHNRIVELEEELERL